ncbi:hypothetical protein M011DRAFT_332907 [Sporormia fimetaria CBS 119925]|uniref:Rhodopsin domain-containing protein n=1 Tax=Sporormia fimetaria CBS 119925 TaxID=1340428 RepID=A0A6A6VFT7_9PLEO|nr:hypothetical protein M011DRAFT_332907 [Sporormia fimetaria CBS 119925]
MYLRPGFVVVVVGCTLTSLSTIIVALRYYCRYYLMGTMGATDHLMLTATILTWGNTVINYYQDDTSRRFRPSHFFKPEKRPQFESALQGTLITWFIYRMTYTVALLFVKLSILFFYRTFASSVKLRRFIYGTMAILILYTFGATLASFFQCENPSDSWSVTFYIGQFDRMKDKSKAKPKCYNPTKLWVATAAVNLFSDVVILLLPIPTLLSLRVPINKRLALIGIFSIGIMAIVASCVRMWVMALWGESAQNSAQFGPDLLLWGQVETNSGIISASIPFLRLIFSRRSQTQKGESEKRVIVISPPKPLEDGDAHRPLQQMDSMTFFEPGNEDPEKGDGGSSPMWGGFITVPASLSSRSRDSGSGDPEKPHLTV